MTSEVDEGDTVENLLVEIHDIEVIKKLNISLSYFYYKRKHGKQKRISFILD